MVFGGMDWGKKDYPEPAKVPGWMKLLYRYGNPQPGFCLWAVFQDIERQRALLDFAGVGSVFSPRNFSMNKPAWSGRASVGIILEKEESPFNRRLPKIVVRTV
jgi:hypothetical protein